MLYLIAPVDEVHDRVIAVLLIAVAVRLLGELTIAVRASALFALTPFGPFAVAT
jgi:hypothetical protein